MSESGVTQNNFFIDQSRRGCGCSPVGCAGGCLGYFLGIAAFGAALVVAPAVPLLGSLVLLFVLAAPPLARSITERVATLALPLLVVGIGLATWGLNWWGQQELDSAATCRDQVASAESNGFDRGRQSPATCAETERNGERFQDLARMNLWAGLAANALCVPLLLLHHRDDRFAVDRIPDNFINQASWAVEDALDSVLGAGESATSSEPSRARHAAIGFGQPADSSLLDEIQSLVDEDTGLAGVEVRQVGREVHLHAESLSQSRQLLLLLGEREIQAEIKSDTGPRTVIARRIT